MTEENKEQPQQRISSNILPLTNAINKAAMAANDQVEQLYNLLTQQLEKVAKLEDQITIENLDHATEVKKLSIRLEELGVDNGKLKTEIEDWQLAIKKNDASLEPGPNEAISILEEEKLKLVEEVAQLKTELGMEPDAQFPPEP